MDISILSPEILLSIFLKLNSDEIVILRRISKKWLEVIDTNKSLWRELEWIEKSGDSIEKAVEMFDQKSASTLEMVSIQQVKRYSHFQQPLAVIGRSRESIKSISILTHHPMLIIAQLLKLARSSPKLEKLVLWDAFESCKQLLPLTHLIPLRKRSDTASSTSNLKVLWLFSDLSREKVEQQILKIPTQFIQSLISFALLGASTFQQIRPLLVKFSGTIVHLRLSILANDFQMEQPLFCPNLKVLEGFFQNSVSLYFESPNLKHLIIWLGASSVLHGIPSSVEQLWLNSVKHNLLDGDWEHLMSACPNMEIFRMEKEIDMNTRLQPESLIRVLEKRQQMINKGEEIQGLNVVPLQKLVLPLEILSKDQVERARKSAGEVVDVKDYPDFIELRYWDLFKSAIEVD